MSAEDLISLKINDVEVQCAKNRPLIDVIREAGFRVPSFCYYKGLPATANCRMCMVQVKGQRKLLPSCNQPAVAGMEVITESAEIAETRKTMLELILVNHPLDCPVCDKAGECELQDLVFEYGPVESPFRSQKRTFENFDIGEKIKVDMDKCIYCRRCDLFMKQVEQSPLWSITERGAASRMGPLGDVDVEGTWVGNLADICPVGALLDKQFFCEERVWNLKDYAAHRKCKTCSGKVTLGVQDGKVLRVTARKAVDGYVHEWICDECRYEKLNMKHWELEKLAVKKGHSHG